jgi:hypothetical protein
MPRLPLLLLLIAGTARADAPVASYLFPAGGQRGTTVKVRAGGLFLHDKCSWELTGLKTSPHLTRIPTRWFEGPMLPLPDSQRQEDYPQDMLGEVVIDAKAATGPRRFRLWNSEGAAAGPAFVVGELPEVVEEERDGDTSATVTLPVTINGRIFPRENIDRWAFRAIKGQTITCEVHAARIDSPLDSRLEVRGPDGRVLAENDDYHGTDSLVSFTAPADGLYQARISDTQRGGSQRHVYRLTITTGPHVAHVFPLGGRRGDKVTFELTGEGLDKKTVEITVGTDTSAPWMRTLDIDDLPSHRDRTKKVAWPVVLEGRIDRPGSVDNWSLAAKKGDIVELDLRATRLGSRLDGIVELAGDDGKAMQKLERDGRFLVTLPKDGDYTLRVRDRYHSRGGPAFGYRLRIDRPRSGFSLSLPVDALTANRGKPAPLKLDIDRRGGFNDAIELTFAGLPAGVKVTPDKIPAGAANVSLTFTAANDAKIGVSRVTIAGKAKPKTGELSSTMSDDLLLGVGLLAPFKLVGAYDSKNLPRGTVLRKAYKIERHGYAGTLEATLADRQARHLQGVTGPRLTIPADRSEFQYAVTLPPWMEIGRTSRACVMLTGKVSEGGVEHTISTTSQAQNDQMIAVVETGRLSLEAGKKSLPVVAGKSVALPVEVRRGRGLVGPARVEVVLPEGIAGVSAAPLMLGADQSKGVVELRFAGVGRTVTATVRATMKTADGDVTAETTVELVVP